MWDREEPGKDVTCDLLLISGGNHTESPCTLVLGKLGSRPGLLKRQKRLASPGSRPSGCQTCKEHVEGRLWTLRVEDYVSSERGR